VYVDDAGMAPAEAWDRWAAPVLDGHSPGVVDANLLIAVPGLTVAVVVLAGWADPAVAVPAIP
ncbi:MAG: hypothetical protein ACXWEI_12775, partial [Mycobacterium sp.]